MSFARLLMRNFVPKEMLMQYLVNPIAAIIKWTFDHILVPIGELPAIININNIFAVLFIAGILLWLRMQAKYNKKAENNPGQIK